MPTDDQQHPAQPPEGGELTPERVVAELSALAFSDPARLCALNGPEDIAALPEAARRAIAGWNWDRQGNFVVRLAPKARALDLLGKHLGLWTAKAAADANAPAPAHDPAALPADPQDAARAYQALMTED